MATSEILKILCIHGYRQSADGFRKKTGAFRKIPIIKKSTELVFVTAPNKVPSSADNGASGDGNGDGGEEMGWWFSAPDSTYMAQDYTECCKGYQESLDMITQVFKEQGPFDGIISFSQGASFASLLCGIQEQNPDSPIKFDFVILVAGFMSRQSSHSSLYSKEISIPSLHVYGDTDRVIQKEMSEDLLQYFTEPETLKHDGGHLIPTGAPHKPVYTAFLQKMIHRKVDKS